MVQRRIEIGSQLYINKYDTPKQVRRWVEQMKQCDLSVIRLFVQWGHVEPKEGVYDFAAYDACFDAAASAGMKVVPTLMAVSPPGWMRATGGSQDVGNIDCPAFWEKALRYVDRVVERYRSSPSLHSWILWNEPSRTIKPVPHSIAAFREYLRQAYGDDIARLNRLYHRQYDSFDQIGQDADAGSTSLEFKGYVEKLDWIRFTGHNLCRKLSDIRRRIADIDRDHPVHVNPHSVAQNRLSSGQWVWDEAKVVDFLGCSSHPVWHSTRFAPERVDHSVAYFADIMRSATPDKNGLFWVTELQGGSTLFSSMRSYSPSPADITHWMWESIGSGASAVVFWCFNTRSGGYEGGEWGLLDHRQEPSERLLAAQSVARTLRRHQELFSDARPRRPDIWLLCSESSFALGLVEGKGYATDDPRNEQMNADAVAGAYLMCADLGLEIGFIDEQTLRSSGLPAGAVLLAPSCTALADQTVAAMKKLVETGGTLIADGLIGFKDPDGFISPDNKQALDDIFGAELADAGGMDVPFTLPLAGRRSRLDGWFTRCAMANVRRAKVLGTLEDGRPAVVKNSLGKGVAVRIGTTFFQRYLSKPTKSHLAFLKSMLPPASQATVRLANPSSRLRLRVLSGPGHDVLIFLNRGGPARATIRSPRAGELRPLDGGKAVAVRKGAAASVALARDEVKLMVLKR